MTDMISLPPRPGSDDEVEERLAIHHEAWRANLLSTAPADRPAAEAAIADGYRSLGLKPPRVLWVPSPLRGAIAYQVLAHRGGVRSPHARGDVGTGANRDFNALREPFGYSVDRIHRVEQRIDDRTPAARRDSRARIQGLGWRATRWLRDWLPLELPSALDAADDGILDAPLEDERFGALAMGTSAEGFRDLVGDELFNVVAAHAVRQAFVSAITNGSARRTVQAMQPGQFDVRTPYWSEIERVHGRPFVSRIADATRERERLDAVSRIARAAGPWWALRDIAIVSERPLVARADERGRWHSDSGPALAFADGFARYVWHGVEVDQAIVDAPESITIQDIDDEVNAEQRRVLVERFSMERLVREGGAELIDTDETGRLWRRHLPRTWGAGGEDVLTVEVLNSTPEPDGTRRTYFLRVPPHTTTAREGVAWTFGMASSQYEPAVES